MLAPIMLCPTCGRDLASISIAYRLLRSELIVSKLGHVDSLRSRREGISTDAIFMQFGLDPRINGCCRSVVEGMQLPDELGLPTK